MGFLDAAETLRRVRDESGEEIGLAGFLELFTSVAAATPLVTRPQTLDSVLAGDPATVRTGEKKCLLILGCNEGIFPRQPESDGMLTSADREKLVLAGLPVQGRAEEKLCDERFAVYKAVTTPSEQLILTYAAADVSGGELSPSEVILSLQSVFPALQSPRAAASTRCFTATARRPPFCRRLACRTEPPAGRWKNCWKSGKAGKNVFGGWIRKQIKRICSCTPPSCRGCCLHR